MKHLDDVAVGADETTAQVKSFPVESFIDELRESFGSVANFYFCRNSHTVGVKFVPRPTSEVSEDPEKVSIPNKPVFDPALLVEDVKVLGKGLVKDVQIKFSTR